MNEKTLIIAIVSLLAIGFLSLLFIIVPWFSGHGFSDLRASLLDDAIVFVFLVLFVYSFYMNTKIH